MQKLIKIFLGSFIFFFSIALNLYSYPLSSNADIGKALSLDAKSSNTALQILDDAKKTVEKNEYKRKRKITFLEPLKFFDLSDKYAVIAYGAKFHTGEDAIVGILVVKNNNKIEVPSSNPYIIWKGDADIKSFNTISDDVLSKYYRGMGIKDVYPIYSQMKVRKLINSKADKVHKHSGSDITDGVISEQFIDPSITRDKELKEALAKKADIAMVITATKKNKPEASVDAGTVESLKSKIAELEKKVARLQILLKGVTRKNNDIYFNNANLYVVNGTGNTESSNSTGNIIVGYNKKGKVSGSHNIVIGDGNKAVSYGGLISGKNNSVSGAYGVSAGGNNNRVSSPYGTAVGGQGNKVTGKFATAAGGEQNHAGGNYSIIAGGKKRSVLNENPHFIQ